MARTQDEIRSEITNKIIEALKQGLRPWSCPWRKDPNAGFPTNIDSKKQYRGINPFLLQITALCEGYDSRWWGTYDQWKNLGGQVRKGQHGTQVVFYKTFDVDDTTKPTGKRKVFILRTYTVFNLSQVDGDKLDKYRPAPITEADTAAVSWEPAEKLIAATGAKIHYGGGQAFYNRPSPAGTFPNHTGGDFIMVPKQSQFIDPHEFFVVQFHELAHWSEIRLQWEDKYAMGELVAEITACYLAAETNIPNNSLENHNRYLANWLTQMENDPKWIFQASSQASKVADFLRSFSQPQIETETIDEEAA